MGLNELVFTVGVPKKAALETLAVVVTVPYTG